MKTNDLGRFLKETARTNWQQGNWRQGLDMSPEAFEEVCKAFAFAWSFLNEKLGLGIKGIEITDRPAGHLHIGGHVLDIAGSIDSESRFLIVSLNAIPGLHTSYFTERRGYENVEVNGRLEELERPKQYAHYMFAAPCLISMNLERGKKESAMEALIDAARVRDGRFH